MTLNTVDDRVAMSASDPEMMRIGRCAILGRLGEGAMGVVYRAYDESLDRKVALKLLRKGLTRMAKRRRVVSRDEREVGAGWLGAGAGLADETAAILNKQSLSREITIGGIQVP